MPETVAVAMSGGVDSSVAAALLLQQGYRVLGLTMKLQPGQSAVDAENASPAETIAQKLGIPHQIIDLSAVFGECVLTDFREQYGAGRTPNPCVRCNYYVKFSALLEAAIRLGADRLATGHYARIATNAGRPTLLKAIDTTKDQSYFLYRLSSETLSRLLFPVGGLKKKEVKAIAADFELPVSDRESQDICFLPGGDYRSFLAQMPDSSGEIVDEEGRVVGKHNGLWRYTIGQRHGLPLSSTQPSFVVWLDAANKQVVVGPRESLLARRITAGDWSWVSGQAPSDCQNVFSRIRYRSEGIQVRSLAERGGSIDIELASPAWAPAPGQSIVLYRGEEVLGGGIIQTWQRD